MQVSSIAVSGNNIFVGTSPRGIFKTSNNGKNWESIHLDLNVLDVISLAVKERKIYSGTFKDCIFVSTDFGNSWSSIMNNLPFWVVPAISISDDTIYAGSSNGELYKSTINDYNWIKVNSWGREIYSILIDKSNIFVCTYGVFLSVNNGLSWKEIKIMNRTDINLLAISGKNIFAGNYSFKLDGLYSGIFLSTDYGDSWKNISNGLENFSTHFLRIYGKYIYAGTRGRGVYGDKLTDYGLSVEEV